MKKRQNGKKDHSSPQPEETGWGETAAAFIMAAFLTFMLWKLAEQHGGCDPAWGRMIQIEGDTVCVAK